MQTNPTTTRTKKTSSCPPTTVRLSDNAFYLIALASLLKKAVEPGSIHQMLLPGAASGIGNSPAC
ncbi:MAG: hypothetical protein ABIR30_04470 [Chitinophagaceae bacterium]